jgi:hypothetical protein
MLTVARVGGTLAKVELVSEETGLEDGAFLSTQ